WIDTQGIEGLARDPIGFAHGFQKQLSRATKVPWMIATSDDQTWLPEAPLGLVDRAVGWYFKQLMALATRDAKVYVAFLKVAQLLEPPQRLFAPWLALAALRQGLRRTAPALPTPPKPVRDREATRRRARIPS